MIVKALVAASLVAAPIATSDDVQFNQYPQVRQVVCDQGKGSAVRTNKGWVSVNHVTELTHCTIDGWPIFAVPEGDLDFSRLTTLAPSGRGVRVNCEGFKAGEYYWSAGFAEGKPYQTNVRVQAIGMKGWKGFAVLVGDHYFIPGMSGGIVMDRSGAIVGMVNAFNPFLSLSFSRPMSETSLCREGANAR